MGLRGKILMKKFLSKLGKWVMVIGYNRAMFQLRLLGYTSEANEIASQLNKIKAPV